MTKGPLGNDRLVEVGPFKYDENAPPEIDSFVPPVVTDSFGHKQYERQWTRSEPFDAQPDTDEPHGVTGMYMPEIKRCLVDNRAYIHHPEQLDAIDSGFIGSLNPQFQSQTAELPNPEGLLVIPFSVVYTEENVGHRVSASLPEMASYVNYYVGGSFVETGIRTFEDTSQITADDIYSMVYALATLDIEIETGCDVRHRFRRRFGIRRFPFLGSMYARLKREGEYPELQMSRSNNVIRSRIDGS